MNNDQLGFGVGHGLIAVDLEDGQNEDFGPSLIQDRVVASDHVEEESD